MAGIIYKKIFDFYNPRVLFVVFLFFFVWPSSKEFFWVMGSIFSLIDKGSVYGVVYLIIITGSSFLQAQVYKKGLSGTIFPWWHPENWPAYVIALLFSTFLIYFLNLVFNAQVDFAEKAIFVWLMTISIHFLIIPLLILVSILLTIFKFGYIAFGFNCCYTIATWQYTGVVEIHILFERVIEGVSVMPLNIFGFSIPQLPSWSGWVLFFINLALVIKTFMSSFK